MTVFAILMPTSQPAIAKAIEDEFPNDHFSLSDTQWLISSNQTVYEISARIKLHDIKNPQNESLGNAVVFATSSYYGKGPPAVWEWLKTKLEATQNG